LSGGFPAPSRTIIEAHRIRTCPLAAASEKRIMIISKHVIAAALRERRQDARAEWVDRTLPDDVDPYRHSGLLATLNLTVADLTGKEGTS
jgi:hypothetical protein